MKRKGRTKRLSPEREQELYKRYRRQYRVRRKHGVAALCRDYNLSPSGVRAYGRTLPKTFAALDSALISPGKAAEGKAGRKPALSPQRAARLRLRLAVYLRVMHRDGPAALRRDFRLGRSALRAYTRRLHKRDVHSQESVEPRSPTRNVPSTRSSTALYHS